MKLTGFKNKKGYSWTLTQLKLNEFTANPFFPKFISLEAMGSSKVDVK